MNQAKILTVMFIGWLGIFLASPAFSEEKKSALMYFYAVVGVGPSAAPSASSGILEGTSTQGATLSQTTGSTTLSGEGNTDLSAQKSKKSDSQKKVR